MQSIRATTSDNTWKPETMAELVAIHGKLPSIEDLRENLISEKSELKKIEAYNADLDQRGSDLKSTVDNLEIKLQASSTKFAADPEDRECFAIDRRLNDAVLELQLFSLGKEGKATGWVTKRIEKLEIDIASLRSLERYILSVKELMDYTRLNEPVNDNRIKISESIVSGVKISGSECGRMPRAEKLIKLCECLLFKRKNVWIDAGFSELVRSTDMSCSANLK